MEEEIIALTSTSKRPLWMKHDIFDMTFRTFRTEAFANQEVVRTNTKSGILNISSPELAFLDSILTKYGEINNLKIKVPCKLLEIPQFCVSSQDKRDV